jgi:hypothetical protein
MNRQGLLGSLLGVGTVLYAGATWAAQCVINFGPPDIAPLNYNEQCLSFVVDANPYQERNCEGGRWGLVRPVSSPSYGHLHLAWEDPNISCVAPNGCFGFLSGAICQNIPSPGHNNTQRFVSSHTGDQWIQITLRNNIGAPSQATISTFRVRGTTSLDVWFRKPDGTWWIFNDLPPGNWALNQPTIEIRVHQDGGPSWSFDDVVFTY